LSSSRAGTGSPAGAAVFQPAEEVMPGALDVIEAGCGAAALALALHCDRRSKPPDGLRTGPITAASDM